MTFETAKGQEFARRQGRTLDIRNRDLDWLDEKVVEIEWEIERMRFELWLIGKELPPPDD